MSNSDLSLMVSPRLGLPALDLYKINSSANVQ